MSHIFSYTARASLAWSSKANTRATRYLLRTTPTFERIIAMCELLSFVAAGARPVLSIFQND